MRRAISLYTQLLPESKAYLQEVAEEAPPGRNGTAEDVAKAVLLLASEAASFITGEYVTVNGGPYMRG